MPSYEQSICDQSTLRVSAGYPTYPSGGYHGGIDTIHPNYQSFAPVAGTVVRAWDWQGGTDGNDSWGNHIIVDIGNGNYWLAAHFASQIFSVGDAIAKGQFIGTQGKTGNVTGIHTHWEYWVGGFGTAYRVDPSAILGIPNAVGTYNVTWDATNPPEPPGPGPTKKLPVWLYFKLRKGL